MELILHRDFLLFAKLQEIAPHLTADESLQRVDGIIDRRGMQADDRQACLVDAPRPFFQAEGGDVVGIDHHAPQFRSRRHPTREEDLRLVEIRILIVRRDEGIPEDIPAGGRLTLENAHPEALLEVQAQGSQFRPRDAAGDAVAPGCPFGTGLQGEEIPAEVELPVEAGLVVHHPPHRIDLGAIIGLLQRRIRREEDLHAVLRIHAPFVRERLGQRQGRITHLETEEEALSRTVTVEMRIIVEPAPGSVQRFRGETLSQVRQDGRIRAFPASGTKHNHTANKGQGTQNRTIHFRGG